MSRAPSQAIVFDLDGTLVDSVPLFASILRRMRVLRGATPFVDLVEGRRLVSAGAHALVSGLLGEAAADPAGDLDEFRQAYAARPTPPDCLFPGVAEMLATAAARGYRLGICSNKPEGLCSKIVRDLGLTDVFAAVTGAIEGEGLKPDPASLNRTLARMTTEAASACFVGDSRQDRGAAAAAGVRFVRVDYGYETHHSDPREPCVASAAELMEVIERL